MNNIFNGAEYIFKVEINELKEKWLGPESNQRHMDFQSTALPTELPSHTQNRYDYIEKRGKIYLVNTAKQKYLIKIQKIYTA